MKTIDVQQGSQEWLAVRAKHFTASEAPAMLGLSAYMTRAELLRQKATGIAREVDANTQRRFDDGHAAEAAARTIAEKIIGEDLFPVTGSIEIEGLSLLASFDGLTMCEDVGWENKLWNEVFADYVAAQNDAPDTHWPQLEQQLLISGAARILFTVSDGTEEKTVHCWYESRPERRARLIAGWKQFAEDVANYQHTPEKVEAIGRAPETLPALFVEVTGMVKSSNLVEFKNHAMDVFAAIKTDLQTDEDFANAEKTAKWCKDVEDRLESTKAHALSQTASIDELFRAIDDIKEESRTVRLKLERAVKAEKENRRMEIINGASKELAEHIKALSARVGVPVQLLGINFAEAIKGLKSLASMRSSMSAALANAKVDASAIADRIEANKKTVDDFSLLPDWIAVCTKAPEDFAALLAMRIQQRKEAEDKRLEDERTRIRQEEEARAQATVAKAEVAPTPRPVTAAPAANIQPIQPQAESGATMKLGEICTVTGITVTADFLARLGFQPVSTEKNAKLYLQSSFPAICNAISRHIDSVAITYQRNAA